MKSCQDMEEECLENLLGPSCVIHNDLSGARQGSSYTNCSFVINNEVEANNNNNISNNNNKTGLEPMPKSSHSCVRFKDDATPGGRPPDMQALISKPVKFELGDSSAALQPGE